MQLLQMNFGIKSRCAACFLLISLSKSASKSGKIQGSPTSVFSTTPRSCFYPLTCLKEIKLYCSLGFEALVGRHNVSVGTWPLEHYYAISVNNHSFLTACIGSRTCHKKIPVPLPTFSKEIVKGLPKPPASLNAATLGARFCEESAERGKIETLAYSCIL